MRSCAFEESYTQKCADSDIADLSLTVSLFHSYYLHHSLGTCSNSPTTHMFKRLNVLGVMALNEFIVYPNPPNCRFSMACSTPKIHAEKLKIWKYYNWLVVEPPLWKLWIRQLGLWHSQTTNQIIIGKQNKSSFSHPGFTLFGISLTESLVQPIPRHLERYLCQGPLVAPFTSKCHSCGPQIRFESSTRWPCRWLFIGVPPRN